MDQMEVCFYPNHLKVQLCMAPGNVHLVLGSGNHKVAPEARIVIIAICAQMESLRLGRKLKLLQYAWVSLKIIQAMAHQYRMLGKRCKVLTLKSPLLHWTQ